ncbi:MAG: 1,2-phenylacetyl-CoA epoxidase subunit PaaE, partial [Ginsengibacter sp.]
MALHFFPLTVSDVRQETPDCVSIAFTIPELLKKEFDFIQGQNITIKTNLDDVRRSYSICSSPMQNELRVAVKKVNNGIFSTYATEKLKPGDVLEVMSPTGTFYTEIKQGQKKDYLFFAAGSGITPVISIIKTILSTEKESQVTLVYGNKNISSIIFREELEALKNQHLENLNVIHILSREKTEADLNTGRIDVNKCKELSRLFNWKSIDEFFICGPEAMIFSVKEYLEQEGVAKEKIHFELFTTPTKKHTQIYEAVVQPEKEGAAVTIKVDGRSYDFNLEYNGNTILEEGLSHEIDLPFACKGGVCCSCKAKLLEGKVEMEANYGLEDSEVKDGYILTCQSHPRTTRVIVDYDV